jgi:hypothetical protein
MYDVCSCNLVPAGAHEKIQKIILVPREMQLGAWPNGRGRILQPSGCQCNHCDQVVAHVAPIIKQLSRIMHAPVAGGGPVDHDSRLRALTSAVVSTHSQQVATLCGVLVCNLHESDQCSAGGG